MNRLRVNGIEICYALEGSGEPLILIGGFGMTKEFWSLQMGALASRFRVLAFDNRGAGESTVPSGPFTMADMAADTVALMDALGMDSAHIFGVSMGGMIAQVLCIDYQDRIRKAVLACTSHGGIDAVSPDEEVLAALAQAADPDLTPEQAARRIVPCLFSGRFLREAPARVEAFIRLSVEHALSAQGAAGQLAALGSFASEPRLRGIRSPILLMAGSDDRMIPPKNAELLSEKIPGAELKILPDVGHNVYYEAPEEVNNILVDFLVR